MTCYCLADCTSVDNAGDAPAVLARDRANIMNWDNENWRSLWTLEMISRVAVHQSGITARVAPSPDDPRKDGILLENTANVDWSRWDLDELVDEVMALWLEGNFERV